MKRHKIKHPRKRLEMPEAMKRLQFKRPKKLKTPDLEDDVEEVVRLMKRKPVEKKIDVDGCSVCNDKNHFPHKCPCLDKIPPGVVIGPLYDEVCIGCGKIGEICCSKGAYAVLRECGICLAIGHWYWEDRCSKNWMLQLPSIEHSIREVPSTEQSLENSLLNKEEDEVMVDVGKDNKKEDEDEVVIEDDNGKEDEAKAKPRSPKAMKRLQFKRPKKLKTLDLEDDVEEVVRLMKRKPVKKKIDVDGCSICNDKNHFPHKCPCLDKIPPGVVIGPLYDEVCIGCGKIGEICCSKGAYAVLRECGICLAIGHWYWEDRCSKNWMLQLPSIEHSIREVPSTEQSLENSLLNKEEDEVMVDVGKDNKKEDEVVVEDDNGKEDEAKAKPRSPKAMKRHKIKHPRKLLEIPEAMKRLQFKRPKKLKTPDLEDDVEEVVRLMKRKPVKKEIDVDGCAVCNDKNHFPHKCPCLDKIPPGVVIGPLYDEVCIGCGKIGEICCSKGAYAVLRECGACMAIGHWYWDDRCSKNFRRPPWMLELPSIEHSIREVPSTEQSLENSLLNKEEDEFMVNVGKDNKNEDEVAVLDDNGKEDESKGEYC
ncbi:hypothetical protein ABKV19_024703 [Rosa sericea]